jgi:hypothetical protein
MRRLLWYGNSSGWDRNPNSSDNPVCLSVQLYGTYCQHLGAAVEHQDREPYEEAGPKNFISDDPYQGTPHGFLSQTSQADVLYDMMLNEAEEAFQQSPAS